jgi:hypothetical protein
LQVAFRELSTLRSLRSLRLCGKKKMKFVPNSPTFLEFFNRKGAESAKISDFKISSERDTFKII